MPMRGLTLRFPRDWYSLFPESEVCFVSTVVYMMKI